MRSRGVRPGVVQHTQRAGDKAAQVGALRDRTLGSFQTFSKLSSLGAFTDSTQPADTYNASDDPCEMYFVTSRNFNFGGGQCVNGCNGLIVWGLYGTIGSQTMSGVTVAMPVQPGSALVSVSFGASSGSILEPRRYWTRPGADIRA